MAANRDVLALAGSDLATRHDLFGFVVDERHQREPEDPSRIGTMRVALQNQRDDLLVFVAVLDDKLSAIARTEAVPNYLVHATCLLHRKPDTPGTFWQGWNRLHAAMGHRFYGVWAAVSNALGSTPRRSSLVENLNSRLRNYFTLRQHLGDPYLDLLRFSLNHRRFVLSRRSERKRKSPRALMTGQDHPHRLTIRGLGPLHPQRS